MKRNVITIILLLFIGVDRAAHHISYQRDFTDDVVDDLSVRLFDHVLTFMDKLLNKFSSAADTNNVASADLENTTILRKKARTRTASGKKILKKKGPTRFRYRKRRAKLNYKLYMDQVTKYSKKSARIQWEKFQRNYFIDCREPMDAGIMNLTALKDFMVKGFMINGERHRLLHPRLKLKYDINFTADEKRRKIKVSSFKVPVSKKVLKMLATRFLYHNGCQDIFQLSATRGNRLGHSIKWIVRPKGLPTPGTRRRQDLGEEGPMRKRITSVDEEPAGEDPADEDAMA